MDIDILSKVQAVHICVLQLVHSVTASHLYCFAQPAPIRVGHMKYGTKTSYETHFNYLQEHIESIVHCMTCLSLRGDSLEINICNCSSLSLWNMCTSPSNWFVFNLQTLIYATCLIQPSHCLLQSTELYLSSTQCQYVVNYNISCTNLIFTFTFFP